MLNWLKLDPRYQREAGMPAVCPGCLGVPEDLEAGRAVPVVRREGPAAPHP